MTVKPQQEPPGENQGQIRGNGKRPQDFKPGTTIGAEYRWKPGQSGNPKGRPPLVLSDVIRRRLQSSAATSQRGKDLAEKLTMDSDTATLGDVLMEAVIELALAGDLGAIKEILDRVDGKSVARRTTLRIAGLAGGKPISKLVSGGKLAIRPFVDRL